MALKIDEKVWLTNGKSIRVVDKLGDGGQGIVYKVDCSGEEYALKWYKAEYLKDLDERRLNGKKDFRDNIQANIDKGSPSDKFLWPVALTEETKGDSSTFGYIMKLRPRGYHDFTDIYNSKDRKKNPVKFKGFRASVESALGIVNAFRTLHKAGYFYLDLNDGNFFINTETGDVLICDNDNVTATPKYSLGKPGFIAPELVSGKETKSNALTDAHSLGVVLFRLFMRHDPLMGKKYCESVVLTAQKEIELYGEKPVFIFDPNDASNRPVEGIHSIPIKLWPLYPDYIHEAFVKTFCEGMKNPGKRLTEKEWGEVILRLWDDLLTCSCGVDILWSNKGEKVVCQKCGADAGIPRHIEVNGRRINLFPGNKILRAHVRGGELSTQDVYAQVVANEQDPSKWGLQNKSSDQWSVKKPDGQTLLIAEGKVVSVTPGTEIELPGGPTLVVKQ